MQVAEKSGFSKRVQYYTSREYSQQISQGQDYVLLNPTYFIAILDFDFSQNDNYLTHHLILDKDTQEHLLKDIAFSFIELTKFNKEIDELVSPIDKWTYFLKHAKNLKFVPDYANEDEGLKNAFVEAEIHLWSKEEYAEYDNASIAIQDRRGEMEFAIEKAEKIAKKIAEEKAELKEIETVLSLSQNGVSVEIIAKSLGITDEKVLEILKINK